MLDYKDAEEYLEAQGIAFKVREADESKNYGRSMTVDLLQGEYTIRRVSIRGTITENNLMISRINAFDKLYFEPSGNSLIFVYKDRPGVIASISQIIAEEGVNIEDIRSPHGIDTDQSMAVIKVNKEVSQETIDRIKSEIDCEVACQTVI